FPDDGDPRIFLTAFTGDLGLDDGAPQSVYRLDTDEMIQLTSSDGETFRASLAPGESVELPDGAGSITFESLERFAALDVREDPAKNWALVFAVLAMAGLVASLFVPRRRVWVRVVAGEASTTSVVEVAGLARGDDPHLATDVEQVLDRMTGQGDDGAGGTR
ncbi:MAG TPA: cytochrome c biogenesis protein ResB, partial [Actinomycetales bacterium]|nr:cytochrome c biogenesis protein ResB [Actinomycetales bacterium]